MGENVRGYLDQKGTARHWSARIDDTIIDDIAWQDDDGMRREAERVSGLIAFYDEHVDIEVDGSRS